MHVCIIMVRYTLVHTNYGGIFVKRLNYDQKLTLAAYQYFFGNHYAISSGDSTTNNHVAAQKMCYLLKMAGIRIGDFEFTWNTKGPYSATYQALLRTLDRNQTEVAEFYEKTFAECSVYHKKEEEIKKLRKKLEVDKHDSDYVKWVERLGSLAYIATTMLPGEDFSLINTRLIQKKDVFNNSKTNRHAWNLLKKANVIQRSVY